MRASLSAPPSVVIDPNALSPDGSISLAQWSASPDGKLIAYGLAEGGADWRTVHVREVDTGRVGIAVPLRDGERVLGSLSLVLESRHTTLDTRTAAIQQLERLARRIEGRLETLRQAPPSHEPSA